MRTKSKQLLVAVMALIFCAVTCIALLPAYAAEDTAQFVLLTDTARDGEGNETGANSVQISTAEQGVTVSGSQRDSRSIVVYDQGFKLGDKVSSTVSVNWDYSGLPNNQLKESVYFSVFFVQADKGETGFDPADFKHSSKEGNGISLRLFTCEDYASQDRGEINISTRKSELLNLDSVYSGGGDAARDLGVFFVKGRPIALEVGTEMVNGVEQVYLAATTDRSSEEPGRIHTVKGSVSVSDFLQDTESTAPYYIGFEFSNQNAAERTVSASISAVTAEEAGLAVEPVSVFLKPDQSMQLSAKDSITGEAAGGVTWTAEDETVVSVSAEGLVTGLKAGMTRIFASSADGRKGEAYVTVANNITLSAAQKTLTVGEYAALTATTNPLGLNVLWTSSDEETVSVANGTLLALKEGTATITATVQNFETGDLELSATCEVTVTAYRKPADVHEDGKHFLYSDGVIVGGSGLTGTEDGLSWQGTLQNGTAWSVLGTGLSFDKAMTFDFINRYDVTGTTYANGAGRYLTLAVAPGNADELTAGDLTLGAAGGLQLNLSTNAEWQGYGIKFLLTYQAGAAGTVTNGQTPENKGELTGTDRFANAFARAFCDGTRIQVKMWVENGLFNISFTPVFTEGEVPDGSENMTYPGGSQHDYIGPYTLSFDWSALAGAADSWNVAIGFGNTVAANSANVDLTVENVNVGKLYGVEISRPTHQMAVDTQFRLTGTTNPNSYVAAEAGWTSSDPAVATVDENGNVTAVSSGTAAITWTVDGLSASCEVTVIGGLTVTEKARTLKAGESWTISATVDPAEVKPTFASGDDRIATVDENGKVTAVAAGEVRIFVRVGSLFSEEIVVTVTAGEEPSGGCFGQAFGFGPAGLTALAAALAGAVCLRRKKD